MKNTAENSENIWKIGEKKSVEMWNDMENMEDFCVSHSYTRGGGGGGGRGGGGGGGGEM